MATATAKAKAAQARKAEAAPELAEPVTFEYGGREYVIKPEAVNNLELYEAIEDQKYLTAARGFIGREQWDLFKDDHRLPDGRVPMEPVEGFLEALMEAIGQGNS